MFDSRDLLGSFYFSVSVLGLDHAVPYLPGALAGIVAADASFQEVSGIAVELGIEEVGEGGENRFVHRLPAPARYSNLVLKRGVTPTGSPLSVWVGQTIGSRLLVPIVPLPILVSLLSKEGIPSIVWLFVNAFPVRWEVSQLRSTENELLIETLELSYHYFERLDVKAAMGAAGALAAAVSRS